jgi:seryl-tRNA synthetase
MTYSYAWMLHKKPWRKLKLTEDLRMYADIIIRFSKDITNAENSIKNAIEEANNTILVKGISKGQENEAAKVTKWEIQNDILKLSIESGTLVRATTAALRLNKHLTNILGRELKIGSRELKAESIQFSIQSQYELDEESTTRITAIPNVLDAKYESGRISVKIDEMTEHDLKNNVPDRLVTRVKDILAKTGKPTTAAEELLIVKQGTEKQVKFNKDPVQLALELGWVKEFPGKGQWIYTTPYTQLFEIIKTTLIEEVAQYLDFQPFMLPKLIPLEVMKKMPGYLDDIPEGMYYCFPPPRDPNAFNEFKEKMKITKEIPKETLKKSLKDPEYVLAPAQCEPFWQFYGKETLNQDDFPFKLYDASGWTYRWEGGGVEGMVRMHEFQRIELTYLGTPKQIVETRESILERCIHVADKILDMEWRVNAALPFWARAGSAAIDIQQSENVPAYDLEMYLPYRGPRDKAEWLEIASCFIHKLKFVDSFNIREAKNREIWTGCTGLGLTRWIAAFLATHGFEPDNWPEYAQKKFNKNYKLPTSLMWPQKR